MRHRLAVALGVTLVAFVLSEPIEVTADWTYESDQADTSAGFSVAGAGDLNGDGFEDIVVGSPYWDDSETDQGKISVFLGHAGGLSATPDWTVQGTNNDRIGYSVAAAGDVNGDGFDDFITGAPFFPGSTPPIIQIPTGRARVYLGSNSIPWAPLGQPWTKTGTNNSSFGASVAGAGDINSDGYDDVIIGSPGYSNGQGQEGAAYVFLGSASGLGPNQAWLYQSNLSGAAFGCSVSSAGDVNGDGIGDIVVGALAGQNGPQFVEGLAFAFHGSPQGLPASPNWMGEANVPDAAFGSAVSSAGDVNGDGFDDVVIGAPQYFNASATEGRVYLFLGGPAGLAATQAWEAGGTGDTLVGSSLAGRDLNGDGYSDVVVGLPGLAGFGGGVWVYAGSAAGLATDAKWSFTCHTVNSWAGASVSTVDSQGNGYPSIVIGAPSYHNPEPKEGAVFTAHDPTIPPPAPVSPAQLKLDGSTPIPPGGSTHEPGFTVTAPVDGPLGELIRLELEWQRTGLAFDGSHVSIGAAVPPNSTASVSAGGLAIGSYQWRVRSLNNYGNGSAWTYFSLPDLNEIDVTVTMNAAPPAPTLSISSSVTGIPIPAGGTHFNDGPIRFQTFVTEPNADAYLLEIEARPLGVPLQGVATAIGPSAASGSTAWTDATVSNDVSYHAAGRTRDIWGMASAWVPLGSNSEAEADFRVIAMGSFNVAKGCGSSSGASSTAFFLALILLFIPILKR